jgi:hypothetical protein
MYYCTVNKESHGGLDFNDVIGFKKADFVGDFGRDKKSFIFEFYVLEECIGK